MRANRQITGRVNAKSEVMKPESKGMDLNIGQKKKLIQKLKMVILKKIFTIHFMIGTRNMSVMSYLHNNILTLIQDWTMKGG